MNGLRISRATLGDIPGIVEVVTTTFPQDFERNGQFDVAMCSDFFIQATEDPNEFVVIGKLGEEVVGFVYYVNKPPSNGTVLLDMIGVRKDIQGKGIGTKLICEADDLIVKYIRDVCGITNLATINLSTGFDNPAGQGLYTKAGYELRGTMVGFIGKGNVELVMIKDVGDIPYRKNLWNK